VVLLPDAAPASGVERADDDLAVQLCTALGAVVLCTPWAPHRSGALDRAEAALTWTADHGEELGADPARLAVAGRGAGAAGAAALALRARRRGWPSIRCQVLVLTDAVWLRATGAEVLELNDIDAAAASVRMALSGRGEDR
jgi:acetyl esterase/lipase